MLYSIQSILITDDVAPHDNNYFDTWSHWYMHLKKEVEFRSKVYVKRLFKEHCPKLILRLWLILISSIILYATRNSKGNKKYPTIHLIFCRWRSQQGPM